MSKYGPAIEKQIDALISFMEVSLIRRKFTPTESANMRQVLYTIVHTAQLEAVNTVGNELKNSLNEDNAPTVSNHNLKKLLKSIEWISQPPPF